MVKKRSFFYTVKILWETAEDFGEKEEHNPKNQRGKGEKINLRMHFQTKANSI